MLERIFDGSDFASGVHFFRLRAGDFLQTREFLFSGDVSRRLATTRARDFVLEPL
jgi:hypothetical protein